MNLDDNPASRDRTTSPRRESRQDQSSRPPRLDQADHTPQTSQVLPEMSLAFLVSTTSAKSPPLRYT